MAPRYYPKSEKAAIEVQFAQSFRTLWNDLFEWKGLELIPQQRWSLYPGSKSIEFVPKTHISSFELSEEVRIYTFSTKYSCWLSCKLITQGDPMSSLKHFASFLGTLSQEPFSLFPRYNTSKPLAFSGR